MVFDASVPNAARVYDFFLAGKDNFAADRELAQKILAVLPDTAVVCRDNREFLQRSVRFLAGEAGIRQFLDIGTGLPTMGNVHQIAQETASDSRVAYVDYDPVVLSHARALLANDRDVIVVEGDLRAPEAILADADVRQLIDFSQPVAVLMLAILHIIPDDADPAGCVARLRDALAPGSYLAISHADVSPAHSVGTKRLTEVAREIAGTLKGVERVPSRTRDEIAGFFDGLTLVEPGLTDVSAWRPEGDTVVPENEYMRMIGGVARKD